MTLSTDVAKGEWHWYLSKQYKLDGTPNATQDEDGATSDGTTGRGGPGSSSEPSISTNAGASTTGTDSLAKAASELRGNKPNSSQRELVEDPGVGPATSSRSACETTLVSRNT